MIISKTDYSEDAWYARMAIYARMAKATDLLSRRMIGYSSDSYETNYDIRIEYIISLAEKGRKIASSAGLEYSGKKVNKPSASQ